MLLSVWLNVKVYGHYKFNLGPVQEFLAAEEESWFFLSFEGRRLYRVRLQGDPSRGKPGLG